MLAFWRPAFWIDAEVVADKPPKPEVEKARVFTLEVSPDKAKAICRRSASLTKASTLS